jgi:hypothetical protein
VYYYPLTCCSLHTDHTAGNSVVYSNRCQQVSTAAAGTAGNLPSSVLVAGYVPRLTAVVCVVSAMGIQELVSLTHYCSGVVAASAV